MIHLSIEPCRWTFLSKWFLVCFFHLVLFDVCFSQRRSYANRISRRQRKLYSWRLFDLICFFSFPLLRFFRSYHSTAPYVRKLLNLIATPMSMPSRLPLQTYNFLIRFLIVIAILSWIIIHFYWHLFDFIFVHYFIWHCNWIDWIRYHTTRACCSFDRISSASMLALFSSWYIGWSRAYPRLSQYQIDDRI